MIRNGGELSDLEYLPTKTNIQNISRSRARAPLVSLGPLYDTIVDLNKSKIIRNNGELTYLDYLHTKQNI